MRCSDLSCSNTTTVDFFVNILSPLIPKDKFQLATPTGSYLNETIIRAAANFVHFILMITITHHDFHKCRLPIASFVQTLSRLRFHKLMSFSKI